MPGKRVTRDQQRKFFFLIYDKNGPRLPISRAAEEVGISRAQGYRLRDGYDPELTDTTKTGTKRMRDLPPPLPVDKLSTDARAALGDINLFSEMFFARRPSPWRYEAAMRIGELLGTDQREYIDINVFPGIGKTTLFTHDLPAWLLCGGFFEDPRRGRAMRIMLGARVMKVAKNYVRRLRNSLDLQRPHYDRDQNIEAAFILAMMYGRFKPDTGIGEEKIWANDQFLVAQMASVDLYEKEPTVQAASQESGFLGERVNFAAWDDLAVTQNSINPDIAHATDEWFESEGETRIEPGGLLTLVGQRLTPLDLHRKRLDARVEGPDGEMVPLYHHVVFPAHHDRLCDGTHRQWDPRTSSGCLTDAWRLNEKDWSRARSKANYETVYQQEDSDPSRILVQPVWLSGGVDHEGFDSPGSYDRDRGFHEWPSDVGKTVDYVTVDPSAGNWWVAEWWAVQPDTRHNYLIEGRRRKLQAKDFLDWDNSRQEFKGWMHEMQVLSYELKHPIRVWIIEANAAHRYLQQFEHFRRWRAAFPDVQVIPHQTQLNKLDPELGVEGLMPMRYRSGMKHLPKKKGVDVLNYMRQKEKELTTFPFSETDDTVMADWIGEWNLDKVISTGRRAPGISYKLQEFDNLPRYLREQSEEIRYAQ